MNTYKYLYFHIQYQKYNLLEYDIIQLFLNSFKINPSYNKAQNEYNQSKSFILIHHNSCNSKTKGSFHHSCIPKHHYQPQPCWCWFKSYIRYYNTCLGMSAMWILHHSMKNTILIAIIANSSFKRHARISIELWCESKCILQIWFKIATTVISVTYLYFIFCQLLFRTLYFYFHYHTAWSGL